MSSIEAERELAKRTHILARLIERNRAINRTKPTPSGIEPATSISRNAVQLWVKEEEEDLNHVKNLRREVRRIAKNGRGSPTGKKPAETDKTSYGSDRRVVLSTKNGVKQNERESESPRLGTTKMEVPAGVPEVNLAAIAVALKVRLKSADMPPLLQEQAFRYARECLDGMARLNSKAIAHALKKEFDTSYGPAWHCIVGTSFGSFVTHSLGGFLYFSMDKVSILLFKTAVEPLGQ